MCVCIYGDRGEGEDERRKAKNNKTAPEETTRREA